VQPITLGPRILRAETAGVIAAALILYQAGEL
jgi:16S rRNA U1498 N3-methylase RsmE